MSVRAAQDKDKVQFPVCGAPKDLCKKCAHSGPFIGEVMKGSMAVFVEGSMAARVGDMGMIKCPHGGTFKIIKGSSDVIIDGKPAARLGDQAMCNMCQSVGIIISTATKTFTNKL